MKRLDEKMQLIENNKSQKAKRETEKLEGEALREFGPERSEWLIILGRVGLVYAFSGDFKKGNEKIWQAVAKINTLNESLYANEMAAILNNMAFFTQGTMGLEVAQRFRENALAILKRAKNPNMEEVVTCKLGTLDYCLIKPDYELGVTTVKELDEDIQSISPSQTRIYFFYYHNTGKIFYYIGELDEACDRLEASFSMIERETELSPHRADIMFHLALIYEQKNEMIKAREFAGPLVDFYNRLGMESRAERMSEILAL